jgi:hypothetical protein
LGKKTVDADLYEFLKENETGLYRSHEGRKEIVAFVHVNFGSLDEFVEIIGNHWFEEGGLDVQMFRDSICVELNDIFEGFGHGLLDYEKCFDESTWQEYRKEIEAQEVDAK